MGHNSVNVPDNMPFYDASIMHHKGYFLPTDPAYQPQIASTNLVEVTIKKFSVPAAIPVTGTRIAKLHLDMPKLTTQSCGKRKP